MSNGEERTQTMNDTTQSEPLRSGRLLASLRKAIREQIASMRNCAKAARSGKGYAHPELQPLRDASAHAEEFWAKILEETLEANAGTQTCRTPDSAKPNL